MKRILSIIAALLLTVTAAWAQPSGNWTDAGNYAENYKSIENTESSRTIHIETAEQLAKFAKDYPSSYARDWYVYLDDDINLSDH